MRIVDFAAFVGHWPWRFPVEWDASTLQRELQRVGVGHAPTSHLRSVLHPDPAEGNRLLREAVAGNDFFGIVPVINPTVDGWHGELHGDEEAVRVSPGSHGFMPQAAAPVAEWCADRGLPLLVQVRMDDPRYAADEIFHDPELSDVLDLARAQPSTPMVLAGLTYDEVRTALDARLPNVRCEFSHVEWTDGLHLLVRDFGADRLVCGSHAPQLNPAALAVRIADSALTTAERQIIADPFTTRSH